MLELLLLLLGYPAAGLVILSGIILGLIFLDTEGRLILVTLASYLVLWIVVVQLWDKQEQARVAQLYDYSAPAQLDPITGFRDIPPLKRYPSR